MRQRRGTQRFHVQDASRNERQRLREKHGLVTLSALVETTAWLAGFNVLFVAGPCRLEGVEARSDEDIGVGGYDPDYIRLRHT